MLYNVKEELTKEIAIKDIKKEMGLSMYDIQTINYLLSMTNNLTIKDFYKFYKRFNERIPMNDIKEQVLKPLIDKEIIIMGDYSKTNPENQKFSINENLIPTYLKLKRND